MAWSKPVEMAAQERVYNLRQRVKAFKKGSPQRTEAEKYLVEAEATLKEIHAQRDRGDSVQPGRLDGSRLDAAAAALDSIHRRMDAAGVCDCGGRMDATFRTDPPVSEAQRRAMHAAAGGNSTLGISRKVGEEFSEADPGGKLPETK